MPLAALELQPIALDGNDGFAVQAVGIRAGIGGERERWWSAGDALRRLGLFDRVRAPTLRQRAGVRLAAQIARRRAELPVKDVVHDERRQLRARHVAQNRNAELLLGQQAHSGGHPIGVSTMLPHELVPIILDHPAHAVCAEVGDGRQRIGAPSSAATSRENLRRMRLAEWRAPNESFAVVHAVIQLKT